MDWYYYLDKTQTGPISEEEFRELVNNGVVRQDTLVWHAGMENWQEYGQLIAPEKAADTLLPQGQVRCAECQQVFAEEDVIKHGESYICEDCKPVFLQKLKEGAWNDGALEYGGFWIRFAAKMIDALIMLAVMIGLVVVAGMIAGLAAEPTVSLVAILSAYAFGLVFILWFYTYFHGKYGATPGKMACGLKVVVADGSKVSYLRAFGRFFAEWLSQTIFYIGYIIAGFDSQKRALHDHICSTRVVKIK